MIYVLGGDVQEKGIPSSCLESRGHDAQGLRIHLESAPIEVGRLKLRLIHRTFLLEATISIQ
jgi:hypothetical protein